jgi:hypothetical protein
MAEEKKKSSLALGLFLLGTVLFLGGGGYLYFKIFSQETQNKLSRTLQNWTGVKGTLDIYAGGEVVQRFINIDKMTTGTGTDDGKSRPYRYAFGVWDKNLNRVADPGEPTVYFEISDYSTQYVFYQTE